MITAALLLKPACVFKHAFTCSVQHVHTLIDPCNCVQHASMHQRVVGMCVCEHVHVQLSTKPHHLLTSCYLKWAHVRKPRVSHMTPQVFHFLFSASVARILILDRLTIWVFLLSFAMKLKKFFLYKTHRNQKEEEEGQEEESGQKGDGHNRWELQCNHCGKWWWVCCWALLLLFLK